MGINLADITETAGKMVEELLVDPAITRFEAQNGRLPVINIGEFKNNSDQRFDLMQLTRRITSDLRRGGQVEIVSNRSVSTEENTEDNFINDVKVATAARADFYLEGEIGVIQVRAGNTREKTYTFLMELNDRNRRTVWDRFVDISKQDTRSGVGW